MENDHPFVSENGGAVFIPEGYFSFSFPCDRESGNYSVLELGTFYPQIVAVLDSIRKEIRVSVKGFSDLTAEEISSLCGLSLQEAGFAKEREYDEPFLIEGGKEEVQTVRKKIIEKGMNYVWGGRFHHILGNNDKGRAVGILKRLFEKEFLSISTVGIGDSLNDLPMLSVVDQPILLEGEEGVSSEALSPIQNCTIIHGTGPQAWNEVILSIVKPPSPGPEGNKAKES
jgi:mannosyl-3-phosphoglycerate phosphatase